MASIRTNLVVDGEVFCCNSKDTASYVNAAYPPGFAGSKSVAPNKVGGYITNKKEFLAYMSTTFDEEQFEWRSHSPSSTDVVDAPSSRSIATDEELAAIDTVRSWEIGKRMAALLWRFSYQYEKSSATTVTASSIATALSNDYLELAAILKAHGQVTLIAIDDKEKKALIDVELGPLFAAFSKSRENFVTYAPPEFFHFALGYSDFKVNYLEGFGYLLYFDIDFLIVDFNFGVIGKTPTFDSRLAQFNLKIDYWTPEFASIMVLIMKIMDVQSSGSSYTVRVKFDFPPSDYPILKLSQALLSKTFDRLLKLIPEKERSVLAPNEWAPISKPTLTIASLLRKIPMEKLLPVVEMIADQFAASTSSLEVQKLDFPVVDEFMLGVNQRFTDGSGKRRVSLFLFSEQEFQVGAKKLRMTGIARAISLLAGAVRKLVTPESLYGEVRVPSVAQWKRLLKSGRAMRKKVPCEDVLKEFCILPEFPAEIKGGSTTSKLVRSLDVCLEFFPAALECDRLHYVGITPKDNMFGYLWARWFKAKKENFDAAASTFFGYDIRDLGKSVLEADNGFKMIQGDNFQTIAFEKLIAADFGTERHFLYSDAFIVHAAEGDGYNRNNPFHNLPLPTGWPGLIDKTDYPSASDEEYGLYSFFSWAAYRYHSGIVKFHLDPKFSQGFWGVLGKRFLVKDKMCMVWKCGRPHNLEFHFFFSTVGVAVEKPLDEEKEEEEDLTEKGRETTEPKEQPAEVVEGKKEAMEAPKMVLNLDLYAVARGQAIVYFTCVAVYAEVHRTITFVNPIVDMYPSKVDKAHEAKKSNFAIMSSVVRGYRDVSFLPTPPVFDVTVNDQKHAAVRAAKSGRGKLAKGISSEIQAADPFQSAIRDAMAAEEEENAYVEATERRKGVGYVPVASVKKVASVKRPFYFQGKK